MFAWNTTQSENECTKLFAINVSPYSRSFRKGSFHGTIDTYEDESILGVSIRLLEWTIRARKTFGKRFRKQRNILAMTQSLDINAYLTENQRERLQQVSRDNAKEHRYANTNFTAHPIETKDQSPIKSTLTGRTGKEVSSYENRWRKCWKTKWSNGLSAPDRHRLLCPRKREGKFNLVAITNFSARLQQSVYTLFRWLMTLWRSS